MSPEKLVTCIVTQHRGSWKVTFISDEQTPADFKSVGLTEAVEKASRDIGAIYGGALEATETELQFAIYPFSEQAGLILDIHRDSDGFSASDLDGKGLSVNGQTLERLVDDARGSLPNPSEAMFRWVRRMSEVTPG